MTEDQAKMMFESLDDEHKRQQMQGKWENVKGQANDPLGQQKGPSSVSMIEAQTKNVKAELEAIKR